MAGLRYFLGLLVVGMVASETMVMAKAEAAMQDSDFFFRQDLPASPSNAVRPKSRALYRKFRSRSLRGRP
jgi:hypothetical protein